MCVKKNTSPDIFCAVVELRINVLKQDIVKGHLKSYFMLKMICFYANQQIFLTFYSNLSLEKRALFKFLPVRNRNKDFLIF